MSTLDIQMNAREFQESQINLSGKQFMDISKRKTSTYLQIPMDGSHIQKGGLFIRTSAQQNSRHT